MKQFVILSLIFFLLGGCGTIGETDSNGEFIIPEDTIDVRTPPDDYREGRVFIHEVRQVTLNNSPALVVKGSLPESCSRLLHAELNVVSDELAEINMTSWRLADEMCLQVLVDFTYIFKQIDDERILTVESYQHGDEVGDVIR